MDPIAASWFTEAAAATERQGGGDLLRVVLIVTIVGCALAAWLLLRGYNRKDQ
ncbi:hypothetical protein AB0L85_01640 [Streptomyces sp. NPDC052051]|uniref:hypothetical protein n=1 Tax=Streptomyces sp. NPDC052051 TaxID=3154649 RepID=UPI00343F3A30